MSSEPANGAFVAHSEIAIEPGAGSTLEQAFSDRLGEVDAWPGFLKLEVWRDERKPGRYVMVSWWADRGSFTAYMRSDSHDRSHARIPDDPARPRPVAFSRYTVIAT